MNAYWWPGTGLKVGYLKGEEKILATLNPDQIKRITIFKPKGKNQVRSHTAALLILDGGYRISEVLELIFERCDFDNLVVKVQGKGNKHRLVPLSMKMRCFIDMERSTLALGGSCSALGTIRRCEK